MYITTCFDVSARWGVDVQARFKQHDIMLDLNPKSDYNALCPNSDKKEIADMRTRLSDAQKKFNYLYKELDDIYHKLALKLNLADSAFMVLYAIADIGDGCLQKEISAHYSLSRQTINSSVKNLEKQGYLYLTSGSGRDKHIHLTDAGQQFANEHIAPVLAMENAAFDGMTPTEQQELLRLTGKYIQLFHNQTEQHFIKD